MGNRLSLTVCALAAVTSLLAYQANAQQRDFNGFSVEGGRKFGEFKLQLKSTGKTVSPGGLSIEYFVFDNATTIEESSLKATVDKFLLVQKVVGAENDYSAVTKTTVEWSNVQKVAVRQTLEKGQRESTIEVTISFKQPVKQSEVTRMTLPPSAYYETKPTIKTKVTDVKQAFFIVRGEKGLACVLALVDFIGIEQAKHRIVLEQLKAK